MGYLPVLDERVDVLVDEAIAAREALVDPQQVGRARRRGQILSDHAGQLLVGLDELKVGALRRRGRRGAIGRGHRVRVVLFPLKEECADFVGTIFFCCC